MGRFVGPPLSKILLLPVLLAASAASAPPPVAPPVVAPPPQAARVPWPDPAPPYLPLHVLSQPDWSDYDVYPLEARELEQEGVVMPGILVGKDGVPKACRIEQSSGYAELDNGTCDLVLQMRFAPPRDAQGRNVEASFHVRLIWGLSDPTPFGPARIAALLTLDRRQVTACTLEQSGSVPAEWVKLACPTITHEPAFYLASARPGERQAVVVVEVRPAGTPPTPQPPHARLAAQRLTEFEVTREGALRNCRTTRNDGFGVPRIDHQGQCGFFLVKPWFEPDPAGEIPAKGTIEVSVYLPSARAK